MLSEEKKRVILKKLSDGVVSFDQDSVKEAAQEALDEGIDAFGAIMDGLAVGMEVVSDLYEKHEYFVPELLRSSEALYAGLDILKPQIKEDQIREESKTRVLIGTVQGDVHDIGKNIIKTMFEATGFTVYDLGKNVPLEKFVEEQKRTDADIVSLSAMMTTTMVGMKKVVQMVREKSPKVAVMLGGAPLTRGIAEEYGADGYAESSGNAVKEAIKIIRELRGLTP